MADTDGSITIAGLLRSVVRFGVDHAREVLTVAATPVRRSETDRARQRDAVSALYRAFLTRMLDKQSEDHVQNATPFARHLLSPRVGIRHDLIQKRHFGALASMFSVDLRRYHYVAEQLHVCMSLKKKGNVSGLSTPWSSTSQMTFEDRELTGLDVIQSWAVLMSYGHLFGTFATEMGLYRVLLRDAGSRKEFLDSFSHDASRKRAALVLDEGNPYRVHQALALWRLELVRPTIPYVSSLALLYFASDTEKTSRMRSIYRRARQIAYLHLHGLVARGTSLASVDQASMLRQIFQRDGVARTSFVSVDDGFETLLDATDRIHTDALFLSATASSAVRQHLLEFDCWWNARSSQSVVERALLLFERPEDWPVLPESSPHRVTLVWPGAAWGASQRELPISPNAAALVLPSAGNGQDYVHAFGPEGQLPWDLVVRLADHVRRTWNLDVNNADSMRTLVWRSVGRAFVSVLNARLRECVVELEPLDCTDGSRAIATLGEKAGVASRVRHVADRLTDDQRRSELLVTASCIECAEVQDGVVLAPLGRVVVATQHGQTLTDLDVLFFVLAPDENREFCVVRLMVGEVKTGTRRRATKQAKRLHKIIRMTLHPLTAPFDRINNLQWMFEAEDPPHPNQLDVRSLALAALDTG